MVLWGFTEFFTENNKKEDKLEILRYDRLSQNNIWLNLKLNPSTVCHCRI